MLNLFLKYVESYIDYRLCFELPYFRRYSFHSFSFMLLELYATLLVLSIEPHQKKRKNILNRHLVFDEASQSL